MTDDETWPSARENRERTIEHVLAIFRGRGIAGDTTGNSPGTKWTAFNAVAEHLDYGRRYTARTTRCSVRSRTRRSSSGRWTWCRRLTQMSNRVGHR